MIRVQIKEKIGNMVVIEPDVINEGCGRIYIEIPCKQCVLARTYLCKKLRKYRKYTKITKFEPIELTLVG